MKPTATTRLRAHIAMLLAICLLTACHTSAPVAAPVVTSQPAPETVAVAPAPAAAADVVRPDTAIVRSPLDLLVDSLRTLERSQVSLLVYDLTEPRVVASLQPDQRMRPASCTKLLTAITALTQLGPAHLFTTTLMMQPSGSTAQACRTLCVRGSMDPLFSRSDLSALIDTLRQAGIKKIEGDIVLDVTFKDTLRYGEGWCWDDPNPVLYALLVDGRPTFASALRAELKARGISLGGKIREAAAPSGCRTVAQVSHTLQQVLAPTLLESNNLCAETVYFRLAASQRPVRATAKDARRAEEQLLRQLGHGPSDYRLADGSGLSLYNYLSARILTDLLRHAYSREDIVWALFENLPVAGQSGTLKNRMKGTPAERRVWAKTGTVTGVSSLAGYALTKDNHTLCFAIVHNGIERAADARALQDRICIELTR